MENRPTIALITSMLTNPLSMDLLSGINTGLPKDVDLITFTGGALGDKKHIEWIDVSGNIIYDLITPERFDGIIIYGGAIGQFISLEEYEKFCKHFHPIPIVNISYELDGIPSITVSNYTGVYSLVTHLINEHKYRDIAFIKGPEGHLEAEERYRGYREGLESSGLKYREEYVSPGNFSVYSGRMGVGLFIDERKLDLDVIVAVDDDTALGVIKELKERGIKVPEDIAVVGFDDVPLAISTIPTLTTIRQPFKDLGYGAVKMLLKIIDGKPYKTREYIPSVPVIRDSCGCFENVFFQENLLINNQTLLERTRGELRDYLINEYADVINIDINILNELREKIITFIKNRDDITLFKSFNNFLSRQGSISENLKPLNSFIIDFITLLGKSEELNNEDILLLVEKFRVKIYMGAYREGVLKNLEVEMNYFDINDINQILHHRTTFNDLYDDTFKFFNSFGVQSCYIVLFDKENRIGTQSKLVFGYKGNERFAIDGELFPGNSLLPDNYFNILESNSIVTALSSNNEAMGYMVFNMGSVSMDLSHAISWYYSSIYKRNYILDESNKKSIELENTINQLRETQKRLIESEKLASLGNLVAGVAHEINTPLGSGITYGTYIEESAREILESLESGNLKKSKLINSLESLVTASNGLYKNLSRVADLVKSFKEFGVLDHEKSIVKFNLKSAIKDTIALLSLSLNYGDHTIRVQSSKEIELESYKSSITSIITGLITNSIYHGFNNIKQGEVKIHLNRMDERVILTYEDNGVGIDKDKADKIFEPFYTTKRSMGFIGLGLNTIYNLVTHLLHGTIELDTKHKGFKIVINFPLIVSVG